MCHLLPVYHLGMAFLAGSKGQNITLLIEQKYYVYNKTALLIFYSRNTLKIRNWYTCYILTFDPAPKMLFLGDTPEGSDTFQWPVIKRDRVSGLRLMIWDKVKVSLCHYSHAPEESNLWTEWQLFSAWWRLNIRFKDPVGDRVGVELLFNSVEFGVPKQLPADSQRIRDEMW